MLPRTVVVRIKTQVLTNSYCMPVMNLVVVLEGNDENLGTSEGLEVFALCHDLFFFLMFIKIYENKRF